ncbi:hypothetical protein [Pontimicrobium sp. IMCC45349]|uniref:hypothetical protein n=1 Tax=Pontimicrobium sp. IMCC45349 TaxID=3391574 RepID=UPI0039A2B4A6
MRRLIYSVLLLFIAFFNVNLSNSQEYNLNTSLELFWPAPAQAKPAYLQPIVDQTFGTTITRITGDVGTSIQNIPGQNWRNTARHGYSTRQPWNADESMIYLGKHRNLGGSSGPDLFLDGETYEVIKEADLPSGNEHRWHRSDPDLFWIIRDDEIVTWNVHTDEIIQIMSYSGYSDVDMGGTGNFTDDGTKVAVSAVRDSDNTLVMFMLDIVNQTKGPDIDISDINSLGHVSISSLGNYIIIIGTYPSGGDRTKVYTTSGAQVGFWDEYGMPSHYDLATDVNGEEVAVGVSKSNPHKGKLIKRRLSDGLVTELTTGGWPPHTSARALNRPGWVFASTSESTNYGPYLREIIAVKLDGSRIERIAHTRNVLDEYLNETHACPSPSGSRVMFASDWQTNNVPIQGYVADFRNLLIGASNVNAGLDQTICEGESVTLTASGAQIYDWSTGGDTPSILVNPSITTTYTVNGTDSEGNITSDEVTVFVNPLPNANAGEDETICEGESVTLTANGGDSYIWNTGATTQGITVSPNTTTEYTVTVISNNCESTDNVIVNVNPLPIADAGDDTSIIEGENVMLTANGGDSYVWNTGATTQSITVSPNATTEYSVTVASNNCESTDSVVVTVNEDVNANAGEDQTICEGESVTLTANGGDSYMWNTGATTQSITVSPNTTTEYTVTATINNSSDTDSVIVNVNSLPIAEAGEDQTICEGESITLTANGGDSYVWDTGATTQSITVSPNTTTEYSVVVTSNNCESTDDVIVNVNPLSIADAGEDVSIVEGESVILTANGGDSYVWNTGATSQSITVSPNATTEYSVIVSSNNCESTDSVIVTVNAIEVIANAGEDQTICEGESVTLTANGGDSYVWNTGATTQSITVSPNTTTEYTVTATINNSSDTDSVIVNVNPLPIADAGEDVSIIEGESVTLTANGGDSYVWNTGATTQSITVSPNDTTEYSVTVSSNNCESTDSVVVTVNTIEVIADAGEDETICEGESVTLTANGGDSYVWNTGATTQSITVSPNATTEYIVTATINNISDTDTVMVTVNSLPIADAGEDVSIVEGESVTLTANGGDSYVWNTGATTQSIIVSPNVTTEYSVTVTSNNCEDTDSVIVLVNEAINANAGEDVAMCEGDSVTLTATGGDSYLWSTGATSQSITVSPMATSNYTVIVSNELDSDTDEVTVFVNPLPVVDVTNDVTILEGDYVTLSASGADTYEWTNGATQPNIAVSPIESTTYGVLGITNSCSDYKEVTVTVVETVTAYAGEDVYICPGEEITLTAEGGENYLWSNGATTQSITVIPNQDITYTVIVSNELDSDADEISVFMEDCSVVELPIETPNDFAFNVYIENGNPNILNIKVSGLQNNSNFYIHDIIGNMIYHELFDSNNGVQMVKQIDTSIYSDGVYLLTLQEQGRTTTKRIAFR